MPFCSKAPNEQIFAWLTVSGKKAEVFSTNVEGKVVSAWVESNVGDQFELGFRLERGAVGPAFKVSGRVDGSE